MDTLDPVLEHRDTCKEAVASAYGPKDYNCQELCSDPVASQIPLLPPFNEITARAKVQCAEDLWNTRDPEKVALAYSEDSLWRNRNEFLLGRDAIILFLKRKWERELDYKLKKELFLFAENRIAVQFEYSWQDAEGKRFRSYGLEHWEFASDGLMQKRTASVNDLALD